MSQIASGPGSENLGLPLQLIISDTPPVVTQDVVLTVSGSPMPEFTPLQRDGTTQAWEPWVAADGLPVSGVTCYTIPVGASQRVAVYTEGMFNQDAIKWPDGTTEAQIMAAMRGDVKYRKLLYSNKRTGTEPTTAGPGSEAGPAA